MEGKMTIEEYLEKKSKETSAERREAMHATLEKLEHMVNPDKLSVPYVVAEFGLRSEVFAMANGLAQLADVFKKEHRKEGLDLVSEQIKVLAMEALEVLDGLNEAIEKGEVVKS